VWEWLTDVPPTHAVVDDEADDAENSRAVSRTPLSFSKLTASAPPPPPPHSPTSTAASARPPPPSTTATDRCPSPLLRYLVHLNICCTAEGYYYLYKNVRVVFASRAPDDKEHLRSIVKFPDPVYSPYRPVRCGGGGLGENL
jgi:hypothetical protein